MNCISVVVPVYNVDHYIKRCIDSIIAQSFVDFELIFVDDGSKDNCATICEEYALQDSRVRVVHQKNAGVSIARNNGIYLSSADYLLFIDSDDYVDVDYLMKLYYTCKKNNAQMVCCDYSVVKDNHYDEVKCCQDKLRSFSRREAIEFYSEINLKENNSIFRSPWAKIIDRDIVRKKLFPLDREYAEDAACVYLWIWNSITVVHLNYSGYYYCHNSDSICHRKIDTFFVGNFLTEQEWIRFFKKNHFNHLYKMMCERYLRDAAYAYCDSQNNLIFLELLRKGLIRYGRKAGIGIKNNEFYYELAFPFKMKIYWYYKALRRKLRGK